jgi:hypothetical protein
MIGNKKYPKGHGGLSGPNFLPLGSDGHQAKILSTSLGIYVCILIRFVPLKICGLNLMPTMVWVSVVNGASITITIQ